MREANRHFLKSETTMNNVYQYPAMPNASVAAGAGYTYPMHPEVVRDAPGSCPKCGMKLVPAGESAASLAVD